MSGPQKPAHITLFSREQSGNEVQTDRFEFEGAWYEKAGKPFILFDELVEDGTRVRSVLRIDPDKVAVLRHEKAGGHLILDPNHRQRMKHPSPYGMLEFFVTTHQLETRILTDEIQIRAEYSLQLLFDEQEAPDSNKQDVYRSLEILIDGKKESSSDA
ncbi:MAG: DUF1934 domain-containing protein [Firmicutes bacterium]|nr:DUF1934 domain-containing protein [Bacillota bacterium]